MIYEEDIIDLHICLSEIENNLDLTHCKIVTTSSLSTIIKYYKDEEGFIKIIDVVINDKPKPKLKNVLEMYINEKVVVE